MSIGPVELLAQDANGNWTFRTGGAAGSGNACGNWFVGYRDPIANDPKVVPDSAVSAISSATGIDPTFM